MSENRIYKQLDKRRSALLLSLILLFQLLALTYIGFHREGLHIDEHYSYILSNSYDADRIANAPQVWNNWLDGVEFKEFLTVEKGEQFAYKSVYDNNAKDAHPPLFYFLLHTICSFLPGVWSPWIGMIMNIVLILLTQIVLYKLSREVMGNTLWAIVPPAIYGGMQAFVDTTLFIRMYPLVTLLTVLLVWQHYHLLVKEKKAVPILLCGTFTFLGVFTQYYFAFTAFFLAAFSCIWLLLRKKWKYLFPYAAAMLFGVILVFIVFPAGITQITGSETNNVGKEVASNIFDFSGLSASVIYMAKQVFNGVFNGIKASKLLIGSLIIAIAVLLGFLRFTRKDEYKKDDNYKKVLVLFLVLATIVSLIVITVSHISGKFLYVRYLYNVFPVMALVAGTGLWLIAEWLKLNKHLLACGIIIVALVSTFTIAKNQMCSYMYAERAKIESAILEHCEDKPLIVLNNGSNYQPTALLHIISRSKKMYLANYHRIESMDAVLNQVDCSNGVVYIILTDTKWSDGFDGDKTMTQIVEESQLLGNFNKIGSCSFSTAYVALPEN